MRVGLWIAISLVVSVVSVPEVVIEHAFRNWESDLEEDGRKMKVDSENCVVSFKDGNDLKKVKEIKKMQSSVPDLSEEVGYMKEKYASCEGNWTATG